MKDLLKNKKVVVGALAALVLGFYLYDQKRKADLKARAEVLASTPATTTTTTTTVLEKELEIPSGATTPIVGK